MGNEVIMIVVGGFRTIREFKAVLENSSNRTKYSDSVITKIVEIVKGN